MPVIPAFSLGPAGRLGAAFLMRGLRDFSEAAEYIHSLPYGRTSDPSDYTLVLSDGRGTCSTKHALLAALAREHAAPVELMLGIYEMSDENTLGTGIVLHRHGLTSILEAHCYLRYRGTRLDLTRAGGEVAQLPPMLHEERIAPEQIGRYKREVHERFLTRWARARGTTVERAWQIREECIRALETAGREFPLSRERDTALGGEGAVGSQQK